MHMMSQSVRVLECMNSDFVEQSQHLLRRQSSGRAADEVVIEQPAKRARKSVEAPRLSECTVGELASYSLEAIRKAARSAGVDVSRLRQKQAILTALAEHCKSEGFGTTFSLAA